MNPNRSSGVGRPFAKGPPGWRKLCAVVVILCWATLGASAQPAATNSAPTVAELVAQLQTRLAAAQSELGTLAAASASSTNLPPGATAIEAREYRLMAESLVRTYQGHLEEAGRLEEAVRRRHEAEQKAGAWTGFAAPGPYSILLVDELRDSAQSLAANITARLLLGRGNTA